VPRLAVDAREAADALGMSLRHFERYVQPQIRVVYSGRLRLVPVSELQRWLDGQPKGPGAACRLGVIASSCPDTLVGCQAGVGEDLGPLTEGQVGRDDQAAAFVAFGEHLEDQLGGAAWEREVAELV